MSKRKRVLIWLGASGILLGLYVWFFGVATLFVLETRYAAWKAPVINKTPIELSDLSVSTSPGAKFSFAGFEFELPWDIDQEKTKIVGKMEVIVFHTGNAMLVSNPPPREFVNGILKMGFDRDAFRQMYGEEALNSDYLTYRLMLETTPAKVGLFTPRKEAVATAMMLMFKAIAVPSEADAGIFLIHSQEFRGFQYGAPHKRASRVVVDLMGDEGAIEFNIGQKKDGPGSIITQAEINRIVQTTRRVQLQALGAGGGRLF
jgi:hypothetical protein